MAAYEITLKVTVDSPMVQGVNTPDDHAEWALEGGSILRHWVDAHVGERYRMLGAGFEVSVADAKPVATTAKV